MDRTAMMSTEAPGQARRRGMRAPSMATTGLASVLCLGLALSSVYVLPNGMPQPGDLVLAFFVVAAFLLSPRAFLRVRMTWPVYGMGLFVAYTFVITCAWFFILNDPKNLSFPLFYAYNFAILLTLYRLLSVEPAYWYRVLRWGLAAGVVVGFLMMIVNFDLSYARQSGGFNKPNQLAYFGLVSLCNLLLIHRRSPFSPLLLVLCAILSVVLVIASFSLTAIAALAFVLLAILLTYWKDVRVVRGGAYVACALVVLGMTYDFGTARRYFADQWDARVNRIGGKTENVAESRGYDRILNYPEYTIAGAAEGGFERFRDETGKHARIEIHSTFGTLLFSYGVIGLIMTLLILYLVLRQRGLAVKLIATAPLLYAVTHQGLRATGFWLLLLLLILEPGRSRAPRRAERPWPASRLHGGAGLTSERVALSHADHGSQPTPPRY